jgi:hypothetical protein
MIRPEDFTSALNAVPEEELIPTGEISPLTVNEEGELMEKQDEAADADKENPAPEDEPIV